MRRAALRYSSVWESAHKKQATRNHPVHSLLLPLSDYIWCIKCGMIRNEMKHLIPQVPTWPAPTNWSKVRAASAALALRQIQTVQVLKWIDKWTSVNLWGEHCKRKDQVKHNHLRSFGENQATTATPDRWCSKPSSNMSNFNTGEFDASSIGNTEVLAVHELKNV